MIYLNQNLRKNAVALIAIIFTVSCADNHGVEMFEAFDCKQDPMGEYLIIHFKEGENVRHISMNNVEKSYQINWGDYDRNVGFIGTVDMNEFTKISLSERQIINGAEMSFLTLRSSNELSWPGKRDGDWDVIQMGNEVQFGYVDEKCRALIEGYIPDFLFRSRYVVQIGLNAGSERNQAFLAVKPE